MKPLYSDPMLYVDHMDYMVLSSQRTQIDDMICAITKEFCNSFKNSKHDLKWLKIQIFFVSLQVSPIPKKKRDSHCILK